MSLALESLAIEDQVSTPTPGSPHPYIPVDNHDRLNSIQLSSDASGELSVAHSPRSFLGPPGEALSELRNACNPPWLHGVTGTPPGILGLHRADRAGRWVEDARRHADQQPIDLATHATLNCLSLGHGLITARDISRSSPLLHGSIPLDAGSKVSKLRPSPFDKAAHGGNKRVDRHDDRNHGTLQQKASYMMKPHDGQSGDGSSGDEESWPMPETPFMSNEVWTENPARKDLVKSAQFVGNQPKPHQNHKGTGAHRKNVNDASAVRASNANNSAKEGDRRVGRCKMYNCDKGVGFLIDDRLDQVPNDVKIHWTDIYSDQEFKSLAKGEVVEYTLNITANGYSASYVTGPGGRPVMGAEQAIVQASRQTSYKLFKAGALPVKTYRSKWESVVPEGSPVQPTSARSTTSTTPGRAVVNESKPSPATTGFAAKNHAGKAGTADPLHVLTRNDGAAQNQVHHNLNSASRLGGNLSPNVQFSSPGWAQLQSLQSPLNYMHSPNALANSFASPHTPLPGLSHSVMTPNSAESFNMLFPSGYTPHHSSSVRSPSVAIATPSDNSHSFMANQLLNQTQNSMNPADLQSFLAERQLLLQQQALLMNMYQNANLAPAALQSLIQLPGLNRLNKANSMYPAEAQYGAYNAESLSLDPKLQYLGLLPPIALPTGQEASKPSDVLRKRGAGPWRAPGAVELNIDSSGGLRANAVTFTPAGSKSPHGGYSQSKMSQAEDISRNGGDSPLYQIPGRRSVSDPASTGPGGKRSAALAHLQSRNHHVPSPPNGHQSKSGGDKSIHAKRVTFAEHVTPARRVVSHGQAPGTPLASSIEEDGRESEEGSLDGSSESTYINTQKYSVEEIRRLEDVKSVDIAMERLRLAAAPQRLSLKESVWASQPHKEMNPASQTLVE